MNQRGSGDARRPGRVRRGLARWLDPTAARQPAHLAPAHPAPPQPPSQEQVAARVWPAMCEQFALRILTAVYQSAGQLESVEEAEQDEGRLEQLYRIDHAITRIRRQAENMQVLAGRQVEDADRQVTSLMDVVRAASSAIEHYRRVHLGRIVELAVVEYAADDVMRVLTELLDNATRFSPPTVLVVVSAHLTEQGSVLVRIEDAGVGFLPHALAAANERMADPAALPPTDGATQLGMTVVGRIATAHRIRVHLTGRPEGGTTTTVLLPDNLLCEIPEEAPTSPPAPIPPAGPAHGAHLVPVHREPDRPTARIREWSMPESAPAEEESLPRRSPTSLRDEIPTQVMPVLGAPPQPAAEARPWYEDIAAFAAGASDAERSDAPWEAGPNGLHS